MFEVEGKGGSWHTAFYYLAEHVRLLSGGAVNHKELYALVGVDGRYLNHANPIVRKRTAGALSRIVHSDRYMRDMQARYRQDSSAFRAAATVVCEAVQSSQLQDEKDVIAYLRATCWPDVRHGLRNEKVEWRGYLDLFRVDQEAQVLFRSAEDDQSSVLGAGSSRAVEVLASLFHIIAFGCCEREFSRGLADEYPTEALVESAPSGDTECEACLVRFADATHSSIIGAWPVTTDRPFIVGRYADCDVVVGDSSLSRVHCCVYRKGGTWYFEDMGSSNGSCVERDGQVVFDSKHDGANVPHALKRGDSITLSSCCHLWFGFRRADL